MKKEHDNQQANNVIPFPNLKERYYEKGIASMQAQEFDVAVDLLKQAHQLDNEDSRIAVTYLAAQYENGDYSSAKQFAEQLLHQGIGEYYDVLDIYLTILIQLKDHELVVKTIEALLEEKVVPPDKKDHLLTLLQLSRKVSMSARREEKQDEKQDEIIDLDFTNIDKLPEIALQLGSLADRNIQAYLPALIQMLGDQSVHPFLKTIVFNVLREHQIDNTIVVKKLGMEASFNPTKVQPVHETPLFIQINDETTAQLENENPVLLQQLQEMMLRHVFILYPFEYAQTNSLLWVVAYLGIGLEMYGEEWDIEEHALQYGLDMADLTNAYSYLLKLEKISSPIV